MATLSQNIYKAFPKLTEEMFKYLRKICRDFTPRQALIFLTQCGYESAGFTRFTENMNYSAKGLHRVFSKYFDENQAKEYEHKPELIASRVYANRMGNGDEASKEGWLYRGRGAIQLTGKFMYVLLSDAFGVDFVKNPELVSTPEYAIKSAKWYWDYNDIAIKETVKSTTKIINGGYNGLTDRIDLFIKLSTMNVVLD